MASSLDVPHSLGRGGWIYDAATGQRLATLAGWRLTVGGADGPAVVRIVDGPPWVDEDRPPPDGTPLRIILDWGGYYRSGVGMVRPNLAPWTWVADAPLVEGDAALDDVDDPAAQPMILPNGIGRWWCRTHPRVRRLDAWQLRLRAEGATVATWHDLLAAFVDRWTLDRPPPDRMRDPLEWDLVPRAALEAIVDHFLLAAAALLREQADGVA